MPTLKLTTELLLPSDAAACASCLERLIASLRDRPGVSEVHIDRGDPARSLLCLHYNPDVIRVEALQAAAVDAGAALRVRFDHLSVAVTGLRHERRARTIESLLGREPGVLSAAAGAGAGRVYVEFDTSKTSRETLLGAVQRAGLVPEPDPPGAPPEAAGPGGHEEHGPNAHHGPFGERSELIFTLACGASTAAGYAATKLALAPAVPTGLFVLAYILGSWFTVQEVFAALRARKFEIDFLMLTAAAGAAALGEWFEGALLLFLFTMGHALEGYAMGRARKAIEALSKLAPPTARRLDASDAETEVPVETLVPGDRVRVKPNTRVPADGFVLAGVSSVNQAPITGESVPVEKQPVPDAQAAARSPATLAAEHKVFAGTINGPAALTIQVTKPASGSTLARVVKMVAEAETQKSATQLFTDRFERIFVPVILGGVGLLMLAWLVLDEPFAASFYRAMAVLVAASPCALAIATPSAVLAGVARGARGGVLVKGGAHLESLGQIKAIAFDKTGTLTEGKPRLTDVVMLEGAAERELLDVALAVEKLSDHPLASAIVAGAESRREPGAASREATSAEAIIGFGVKAGVDGLPVLIGKPGLFTRDGTLAPQAAEAAERLQREGRTVMIVKWGPRFLGVLGVMDTPRTSAREVVSELHRLGVEQTIMLTGDNVRVGEAVAAAIGIREVRADLLPEQKVAVVAELTRKWTYVAMVGDGVNDAPAMANATVGIAMGAGGSDVALETADVALMADDLRALPFAVGLSRAARRIIRQNLWASVGMVAFLIPATLTGFAGIGLAVSLHEGSTLLVVANALRLLAYRDPGRPGPAAHPSAA